MPRPLNQQKAAVFFINFVGSNASALQYSPNLTTKIVGVKPTKNDDRIQGRAQ